MNKVFEPHLDFCPMGTIVALCIWMLRGRDSWVLHWSASEACNLVMLCPAMTSLSICVGCRHQLELVDGLLSQYGSLCSMLATRLQLDFQAMGCGKHVTREKYPGTPLRMPLHCLSDLVCEGSSLMSHEFGHVSDNFLRSSTRSANFSSDPASGRASKHVGTRLEIDKPQAPKLSIGGWVVVGASGQ